MCLSTITATYDPPLQEEREGWKVFRKGANGPRGVYYHFGQDYQVNTWFTNSHNSLVNWFSEPSGALPTYVSGFHVFVNKEDAWAWARIHSRWEPANVRQVRVRGIKYEGQDDISVTLSPVLVADELYIYE